MHEVRCGDHRQRPRPERPPVEVDLEPGGDLWIQERHDVLARRARDEVRIPHRPVPDRRRLYELRRRRRRAAVPTAPADHDCGRAAVDVVPKPIGGLEREVRDDPIRRARRKPLDVTDAAQAPERTRRAGDERGRGRRVRRNVEQELVAGHDHGNEIARRRVRLVTARAADGRRSAQDRHA